MADDRARHAASPVRALRRPSARRRAVEVIGWRELVALPDLGIPELRAKIDTGARTSALHALDIALIERDGVEWAEFHLPPPPRGRPRVVAARVVDRRAIKNTSGVPEERIVVTTRLVLGRQVWAIETSLADRAAMEFDLILGRTAIRRRKLLVDAGRSYLIGKPKLGVLE